MFLSIIWNNLRKVNFSLFFFYLFSCFFTIIPLFIISIKAISPSPGQPLIENFAFINSSLWQSLIRSLSVAFFSVFFVLIFSYLFAYLVYQIKSKFLKNLMMVLITCPLWSSFFVKLIGLKSFFDLLNGEINSTRGLLYVVIGLVYINLPIAILTIYNSLSNIPKNIINASLDLGCNHLETIAKIIVPYTQKSIVSIIYLVFLPSVTCVSVADFMNKLNGSKLISQTINDLIESGGKEGIGINRLALLTLFLVIFIFLFYVFFRLLKIFYFRIFKGNFCNVFGDQKRP